MYLQVRRFKILCLILSLFSSVTAIANEGGQEAAPAEAHGAAPAAPKRKSSEESYAAVLGKVQALEAKVHSGEQEIQKLVAAKATAHSDQQVNDIIKNMLSLHTDLKKNVEEYERQRSLLRYRYPEKAMTDGREYERMELKSLEEMEGAASLSVSIRKTMEKVRLQFPDKEPSAAASESAPGPNDRRPASERPALLEPVILKK